MPIENEGAPSNWTLRFKHGRLTILLFSEPLTPFSTLKTELLTVLRERYPKGLPPSPLGSGNNIPIPESILDVALAVPVDSYDISKGWEELKLSAGGGGIKDSPKGLGIKDAGVVAYRFRTEDVDEMEGREGHSEFVVEWPSYDETYGETEQAMKVDTKEESPASSEI